MSMAPPRKGKISFVLHVRQLTIKGRIGNSVNSSTRSTERKEQMLSSESLRIILSERIVVVSSLMS